MKEEVEKYLKQTGTRPKPHEAGPHKATISKSPKNRKSRNTAPHPCTPHPRSRHSEEDIEIVEGSEKGDLLATYYADASKGADREPVYCAELGLAVEALREGTTVEQLWSVL